MRIGINALYLLPGGVGGTEIYLRNLLAALAGIDAENVYVVFTNAETGADLAPPRANFVHAPQRVKAAFRPARILYEQSLLPAAAARHGIDVMLNPGFTAPVYLHCPSVTVFHDLQHKVHPEYFRWWDLPFWRVLLFLSAQLSRLVLADSEATAADLRRFYRLGDDKLRVAPLGVNPVFFEIGARRAPEPFLLCVSTLHPHKNLDRLLEAFALFRERHPDFRLVVAGMHGFASRETERRRAELGLDASVELTGWIESDALLDLYARAWAFVYPSTFEGFGLPVLEAMAAGVPTACSAIAPLREVAGEAALYFEPENVEEIAGAMMKLACDRELRAGLAVSGPARAREFPWSRTARATLQALREAAT
ncbi:MAG: glycosyltransferase family 4 protein [Bryobacteraceae bacterium]